MERASLKVLIIEDDSDACANIADIMELDGYRADMAGTVREALGRTNWNEYVGILVDRHLPDGTSEDLVGLLRERAPHAALIVLTGHGDIDNAIAALRHGVADYILKPINAIALRASLDRIRRLRESEARAQQAERLAAIGQMMAVLSHESRNDLNQIALLLGVLNRRLEGQPDLLRQASSAEKALKRVLRLFEDLRGYSAPITLRLEECMLPAVGRQAWTTLSAAWRGRDVRFHESGQCSDLCCRSDPFRLEQAFRNIFENALAACTDPVELNVSWSEAELEGRPAIRVRIRDNGPGLAPEQRRQVFEPFYTTKRGGTGLGMAITKRIIEAHGGCITVGDSSLAGAEFVICLPRTASRPKNLCQPHS
jgi:signal transduction histidine kinase